MKRSVTMKFKLHTVRGSALKTAHVETIVNGQRERRAKQRFRIDQEVRYKMLYGHRIAETGVGRTSNISSSGVWLTTETMLSSGMPVELSMHWPLLLNETCPMKLMIYGCVVRSNERGAAVAIERYEFRTQRSLPAPRATIAAPTDDKRSRREPNFAVR
jgi:hypothetical protein